jgi:hypothetical protein
MPVKLKVNETIGCCGIDCGLCPRYHTKGDSACPGCGGKNFNEKHPSCGCLNCCTIKNGFEVCSYCNEYPCNRFDAERQGYDSFVTHRKIFHNLDLIKNSGIELFIAQQKIRMKILLDFLKKYDEGRSKSFFCLCCALLPLDKLVEAQEFAESFNGTIDIREKNKQLKNNLQKIANNLGIVLKLNRKS